MAILKRAALIIDFPTTQGKKSTCQVKLVHDLKRLIKDNVAIGDHTDLTFETFVAILEKFQVGRSMFFGDCVNLLSRKLQGNTGFKENVNANDRII
jgi:hypothetical protein